MKQAANRSRGTCAADWVRDHAEGPTDRLALIDGGKRFSYRELDRLVERMARFLGRSGVGIGDPVATLLPNSWEMIVVLLATLRQGGIAVPMNPQYQDGEIAATLRGTRARVFFASSTELPRLDRVLDGIDGRSLLRVGVPDAVAPWTPFAEGIADFLDVGGRIERAGEPVGDAPALWLYSSGSTGGSKKISRSRANLVLEADAFHATAGTTQDDVVLCAVPLSHAHGLGNGLLAATRVGATLVVQPRFDRRRILTSIENDHVTIVPGSPFMYKALAETRLDREPDLGSIRLWISAGAPLDAETFRRCRERFGVPIRQLYGSTETGAVSLNLSDDIDESWASVGRPLAGTDVAAFDEAGQRLAAGVEGAIGIATPAMFDRYEDEALNAISVRHGRFFPGDRGYVDEQGRVFVTGRDTLFINVGGNKVDPAEIEALLSGHPKVAECIVLGTKRHGTEIVKAIVVAREKCTSGELLEHCRGRIADFKLPREIEFREEIPRNPLGKVLRKYLL